MEEDAAAAAAAAAAAEHMHHAAAAAATMEGQLQPEAQVVRLGIGLAREGLGQPAVELGVFRVLRLLLSSALVPGMATRTVCPFVL